VHRNVVVTLVLTCLLVWHASQLACGQQGCRYSCAWNIIQVHMLLPLPGCCLYACTCVVIEVYMLLLLLQGAFGGDGGAAGAQP
jgi:hypothetical protein